MITTVRHHLYFVQPVSVLVSSLFFFFSFFFVNLGLFFCFFLLWMDDSFCETWKLFNNQMTKVVKLFFINRIHLDDLIVFKKVFYACLLEFYICLHQGLGEGLHWDTNVDCSSVERLCSLALRWSLLHTCMYVCSGDYY